MLLLAIRHWDEDNFLATLEEISRKIVSMQQRGLMMSLFVGCHSLFSPESRAVHCAAIQRRYVREGRSLAFCQIETDDKGISQ